jgi:uncharacterized protein with HXXEE motif
MKRRLGGVIALIEIASITVLLVLLRQEVIPSKIGVTVVFLLPITFGLHIFEEFIFPGRASDLFKQYHPEYAKAYTDSYFFKINAIPLVVSFLASLGAFDYVRTFSFLGIRTWLAFLSLQGFNALYHMRGAIETKQYSPGMVTGTFFYLPLTILSYAYLFKTGVLDVVSAIICIGIGAASQSVFDYIKAHNMKKAEQI